MPAAPAPDAPAYAPPVWAPGGHLQTALPSLFRRVGGVAYRRERLELADGDFLDLDWQPATAGAPGERVAVVAHGLEGSSGRAYVRGMVRALAARGWDVAAWNHRGCSGEPNRLLRAYHSGATEDLDAVVRHVLAAGYAEAAVVGFSLGGNVTLKWLGDAGPALDPRVVAGVGVSVPVDLAASSATMDRPDRRPYMLRFLRTLRQKTEEKATRFADAPDPGPVRRMRTFAEFDAHVTAPLHGYASAADYYARAASLPVLPRIAAPTLLVNARNDPFLAPSCFPEVPGNPAFRLLAPDEGGHCGWPGRPLGGELWSETAVARWLGAVRAQAASASSTAAPPSTA